MATSTGMRPRLTDVLPLQEHGGTGRCKWFRGVLSASATADVETAAAIVADAAVEWQCRGAEPRYQAWRQAVTEGRSMPPEESRRLTPFIQPAFGLPSKPRPPEHVQGLVAEYVWYILARENLPAELQLRRIEGPGFSVTTPGGDGLIVYEQKDTTLIFRLWEIKQHDSQTHISRTVGRAYSQLSENAEFYLAQLTTLADNYPADLAQLYGGLADLWLERDPSAGAGVAISTSDRYLPTRCLGVSDKRWIRLV